MKHSNLNEAELARVAAWLSASPRSSADWARYSWRFYVTPGRFHYSNLFEVVEDIRASGIAVESGSGENPIRRVFFWRDSNRKSLLEKLSKFRIVELGFDPQISKPSRRHVRRGKVG